MEINIKDNKYKAIFESKIVSSGNGAVAHAQKKYIGDEVIIMVKEKEEKIKLVEKIFSDKKVAKKWEENEN